MKKKIEIVTLIIYISITIAGLLVMFNLVDRFGYDKIGESVVNVAKIMASAVYITDDDLEHLLEIDFDELLDNSVNMQIEDILKDAELSTNIEYAYVIRKLNEREIKYLVDSANI